MTTSSPCQARPGADGQVRCERCRLVIDRDEWNGECPQRPLPLPVPRMGFISGLPDPIRR